MEDNKIIMLQLDKLEQTSKMKFQRNGRQMELVPINTLFG